MKTNLKTAPLKTSALDAARELSPLIVSLRDKTEASRNLADYIDTSILESLRK